MAREERMRRKEWLEVRTWSGEEFEVGDEDTSPNSIRRLEGSIDILEGGDDR